MIDLPRQMEATPVKTVAELQERTGRFAQDVYEFLRLGFTFEVVTLVAAEEDLPLSVLTQTKLPVFVVRGLTREASDQSTLVADASLGWLPADPSTDPGVVVSELGGLTANTQYEITLLVIGKRE